MGSGPRQVVFSPNGSRAYVTNPGAGTVWAIRAATGRVIAQIQAGAGPYSVAVTPGGTQPQDPGRY